MDSLLACTCTLTLVVVQFIPPYWGAALSDAQTPTQTLDDIDHVQSSYEGLQRRELDLCVSQPCPTASVDYVRALYGDLFSSRQGHWDMVSKFREDRTSDLHKQGYQMDKTSTALSGDGDSCCTTDFFYATNSSLVDVWGRKRTLVHFTSLVPPLYQYIPHARCVTNSNSLCEGSCLIEPIYLNLLVYDASSTLGVGFAWFALPGYCSCKNVTP